MRFTDLTAQQKQYLLQLARQSIEHGAKTGKPLQLDCTPLDPPLTEPGSSFVTLHKAGKLRGCIGSLTPSLPLVNDVIKHACSAAFDDHRFQSVNLEEVSSLHIEISILTPQVQMFFDSEAGVIEQLQPFKDGVTLEEGIKRATFLPAVWEKLPDKHLFLEELKYKAGLPKDYWSTTIKVFRYYTICISE